MSPDLFENALRGGDLLYRRANYPAAVEAYRDAVKLRPDEARAHNALAAVLHRAGGRNEAVAEFNVAIRLDPDFAPAYSNLGNLLLELDRPEESLPMCERAVALDANFAGGWNNLGNTLIELRRPREAIECFDKTLALKPPFAERVHVNKSRALLLIGELVEGFAEYEFRLMRDPVQPRGQDFLPPRWKGEPPAGRTLLITSEQGYGDVIQFIRYADLIAKTGGRVIVAAVPELRELIATAPGVSLVPAPQDAPKIDLQIPILSLPHIFSRTLEMIPRDVPYLTAKPQRIERWESLVGNQKSLRVGLAWSSHPTGHDASKKSCPIEYFSTLFQIEGVKFFSVQPGLMVPSPIVDLSAEIADFADTAALMHHLDLIITIDTAAAHLAGALGKETWTILPYAADWRWLMDREDSPWYPSMKLFRQPRAGDWPSAIDAVLRALEDRLRI